MHINRPKTILLFEIDSNISKTTYPLSSPFHYQFGFHRKLSLCIYHALYVIRSRIYTSNYKIWFNVIACDITKASNFCCFFPLHWSTARDFISNLCMHQIDIATKPFNIRSFWNTFFTNANRGYFLLKLLYWNVVNYSLKLTCSHDNGLLTLCLWGQNVCIRLVRLIRFEGFQ